MARAKERAKVRTAKAREKARAKVKKAKGKATAVRAAAKVASKPAMLFLSLHKFRALSAAPLTFFFASLALLLLRMDGWREGPWIFERKRTTKMIKKHQPRDDSQFLFPPTNDTTKHPSAVRPMPSFLCGMEIEKTRSVKRALALFRYSAATKLPTF